MKTTIETKTAGQIIIESDYRGNKLWDVDPKNNMQNYNNHKVKVIRGDLSYSFEFWSSIMNPEIKSDQENVFAFYCSLTDAMAADQSFESFCSGFGYDEDSRTAHRVYKKCEKTYGKVSGVFNSDVDLYELVNEIQETYNC